MKKRWDFSVIKVIFSISKKHKNMKIHEKYMKTHCTERFTQDMKNHHQTLEIHVKN